MKSKQSDYNVGGSWPDAQDTPHIMGTQAKTDRSYKNRKFSALIYNEQLRIRIYNLNKNFTF